MLFAALAIAFQTQDLGSTVRVYTDPPGVVLQVDGVGYRQAMSAVWPAGSKHLLEVDDVVFGGDKSRHRFNNWEDKNGVIPGGRVVTVTADPAVTWYRANFQGQHLMTLSFFACEPGYCPSPGTIYVNKAPVISDQSIYVDANAEVELIAVPNPGYVFAGWGSISANESPQGSVNIVTMTGPVVVSPQFQPARKIQLTTDPDGLEILADRTRVSTPAALDWGWETTHTVAVTSPQVDRFGKWWAFQSWSDGGALSHTYKVTSVLQAATLTAKFVPAAVTQLTTSPPGLRLKVDGRENWASYDFIWGAGEQHRIEAPAQQADAEGRVWRFAGWSNGAAAAYEFTVPADIAPAGVRLLATYTPVGQLQITSTIAGVTVEVDGAACSVPCEVLREAGTVVKVSAPASLPVADGRRADFTGWPGSGSPSVEATYTLAGEPVKVLLDFRLMNRLTATAEPPEGVTWRLDPTSPDGFYDAGSTVSVTASARPGYRFRWWNGDLSGGAATGVVAMNSPRFVEAVLDRVPYVAPSGVANAASGNGEEGVAPGSIISVFGASLSAEAAIGPESPLVQTLANATVRIGDRLLPLFFVSPAQINAQLPPDLAPGSYTLIVSPQGMPDVQAPFEVVRNAPGLFQRVVETEVFVVAAHQDGSAVTAEAPARPGEAITVYGTGFGPADRARPAGFAIPSEPRFTIVDGVSVQLGEAGAFPVSDAFAVPGRVGVDAIDFRVPGEVSRGSLRLRIVVNGKASNVVLLPVQ